MTRTVVAFIAVLVFTASAMFARGTGTADPSDSGTRLAADGAFRDGLYLGKLAAQSHQIARPAVGRWSTNEDRSRFAAGYSAGLQNGSGVAQPAQSAE